MKLQVIEPEPKPGEVDGWNLHYGLWSAELVSPSLVDAETRKVAQNAVILGRQLWGMTGAPTTLIYWGFDPRHPRPDCFKFKMTAEADGVWALQPNISGWSGLIPVDPPHVMILNLPWYQAICAHRAAHPDPAESIHPYDCLIFVIGAEVCKIRRRHWEGGNWPGREEKEQAGHILHQRFSDLIGQQFPAGVTP